MTNAWTDWQPYTGASPYVHWWEKTGRRALAKPKSRRERDFDLVAQFSSVTLDALASPLIQELLRNNTEPSAEEYARSSADRGLEPDATYVPQFALNAGFQESLMTRQGNWIPDSDALPDIDNDTIIVGVIDTGIALGHNRFRMPDGSSRILAAWQQNDVWNKEGQAYLPFGRELYKHQIDTLLDEHSGGSKTGPLDEDALNRATGVLDMQRPLGHREVAGRFAHGTHVLDLAAGHDPSDADADFLRRVKIIAINLPGSITFGESGTFLDNFMTYAVQRVADLADAIWMKNNPGSTGPGYPVVMNISFGKQAGAKSTLDHFPRALRDFHDTRASKGLSPVDFVMPAGNDNLDRCNALLKFGTDSAQVLPWRILPEDQSSNYVEIWSEPFTNAQAYADGKVPVPLLVSLTPPGKQEQDPRQAKPGHVTDLGDYAAVYCDLIRDADTPDVCKFRYVLCIAPTLRQDRRQDTAPAGAWTIKLATPNGEIRAVMSVQTDQAILPGRAIGLRSYFDDPVYVTHDEAGRLVESYAYPAADGKWPKNTDWDPENPSLVRRHGTMNASAAHDYVTCVGGYRVTDGKPMAYSATGRGRKSGGDDGIGVKTDFADGGRRGAPTVLLPTDDGPAHFGVLAAGAANGSVVAMQGTSFAAPQAVRRIVDAHLSGTAAGRSGKWILNDLAKDFEDNDRLLRQTPEQPHYPAEVDAENAGRGRVPTSMPYRVNRLG